MNIYVCFRGNRVNCTFWHTFLSHYISFFSQLSFLIINHANPIELYTVILVTIYMKKIIFFFLGKWCSWRWKFWIRVWLRFWLFKEKIKKKKKSIDFSFLFSMCSKSNNCLPILCKKIQTKFAGFLNFYFADIACIFAKAMNL